jgi:hypothetical protein
MTSISFVHANGDTAKNGKERKETAKETKFDYKATE